MTITAEKKRSVAGRRIAGLLLACALGACSKGGGKEEEKAEAPAPAPVSLSSETEVFKDPKGVYSLSLPKGFQTKEREEEGKSKTMFNFGPGLGMMIATEPAEKGWKADAALKARVEEIAAGKGGVPPGLEVKTSGLVQFGGGSGFELELGGKVSGADVTMQTYTLVGAGKSMSVMINTRGVPPAALQTIKSAVTGTLVIAGAAVAAPPKPAAPPVAAAGAAGATGATASAEMSAERPQQAPSTPAPEPAATAQTARTLMVPPAGVAEVEVEAPPPSPPPPEVDMLPAPVFQEVEPPPAAVPKAAPSAAPARKPGETAPKAPPGAGVVKPPPEPKPTPAQEPEPLTPDWEIARSMLKVSGTMKVGPQNAAIVNDNILRKGETISVEYRQKVYHFRVSAIEGNRVDFEPVR